MNRCARCRQSHDTVGYKTCEPCRTYCAQRSRERRSETGPRIEYTPIDELLELPKVRLLRGLRRHDWVDFGDLLVALEVTYSDTYAKAVSRLVDDGHVARAARCWGTSYRITPEGRAHLEQLLAVDLEACATDAELEDQDEAAA